MRREARGWSVFWRDEKRRWVLAYAGPDGKPRQKVVTADIPKNKKPDAERWCTAWLDEKGIDPAGVLAKVSDLGKTLRELMDPWREVREKAQRDGLLAPATVADGLGLLRRHLLDADGDGAKLGDTPIQSVTPQMCRRWLRAFRGKRSTSTVRNTYFAARAFWADAIAEGWAKENPMNDPGVLRELPVPEKHHEEKESGDTLPASSVQVLLASEAVPLARRVRYALAATLGARDGELAGILWSDVDLDERDPSVRVTKALSLRGPEGFATMGRTKNRRRRIVPLHPAAAAALKDWRAAWQVTGGHEPRPEDPVFIAAHGRRKGAAHRPRSAELLRDDLEAVGLAAPSAIRFHSLRASFISWMAAARVPETTVQRFVDHAGKGVTQRHYTDTAWAEMREALATITLTWPTATAGHNEAHVPAGESKPSAPREPVRNAGDERGIVTDCQSESQVSNDVLRFPKPLAGSSTLPGGATTPSRPGDPRSFLAEAAAACAARSGAATERRSRGVVAHS